MVVDFTPNIMNVTTNLLLFPIVCTSTRSLHIKFLSHLLCLIFITFVNDATYWWRIVKAYNINLKEDHLLIHTLNKVSLMDHFIGLRMNLKDCQGLRVRERKEKKTIFPVWVGVGKKEWNTSSTPLVYKERRKENMLSDFYAIMDIFDTFYFVV